MKFTLEEEKTLENLGYICKSAESLALIHRNNTQTVLRKMNDGSFKFTHRTKVTYGPKKEDWLITHVQGTHTSFEKWVGGHEVPLKQKIWTDRDPLVNTEMEARLMSHPEWYVDRNENQEFMICNRNEKIPLSIGRQESIELMMFLNKKGR